jgi:hypothetical protein
MKNDDLHPCPCCGKLAIFDLGDYEICKWCGWEDDPIQSADPNYSGGANTFNLNQAKAEFQKRVSKNDFFRKDCEA